MNVFKQWLGGLIPSTRRVTSTSRKGRKSTAYQRLEKRNLLATFIVNTASDVVDFNDGLVSLREAITAANTNVVFGDAGPGDASGDRIRFDSALENQTITLNGSELPITEGLTIVGNVTIDAAQSSRVFAIDSALPVRFSQLKLVNGVADNGGAISVKGGGGLTLFRVSIEDSNAVGWGSGSGLGGAVYALESDVRLSSADLLNNRAIYGGGVFSRGGRITVFQSDIVGNKAQKGGAIRVQSGELFSSATLFLDNVALQQGGAVYLGIGTSTAVFQSSSFQGNFAHIAGGAISIDQGVETFIAKSSNFSQNQVSIGEGGAIHNLGDLNILDSKFTSNAASLNGGAIHTQDGSLRVVNSELTGNRTKLGGGAIAADNSALVVLRSKLSGNRAHNTGGGLGNSPNYLQLDAGGAIYANDSQVVISTSDIEENFAYGAGGGILVLGGNAKILQSNISRNKVGTRSFSSGAFYELGGGGIFIADSTLDLIRSTVDRNVDNGKFRAGQGGGILSARTTTRILESTISYNTVNSFGSGGGLSVVGGKALLFKSDFVGNRSYAERRTLGVGAGVSVRALGDQPLAQLTVRGGSFIDNFSEFGGSGLYVTNAIVNIGSTADGESTLFRNNRVESGLGGAFRFSQQERQLQLNESVVIRDAIFENNRGGAADIYAAEIDIQNSRFSQNKNSLSGAPIRVTGRSISLTDNLFENNTPLGDLDVLQRIV